MSAITVPVPPAKQRLLDAQSSAILQQLATATPAQVNAHMLATFPAFTQAQRDTLAALALGLRYVYLQVKP